MAAVLWCFSLKAVWFPKKAAVLQVLKLSSAAISSLLSFTTWCWGYYAWLETRYTEWERQILYPYVCKLERVNKAVCGKANVKRKKKRIVRKLTLPKCNCCVLPFQLSTYHTKIATILAPILFSQDSLPTDFLENVVTSWYGSSQCNFCFTSNNLASHIYIKSQFTRKYIYLCVCKKEF